MGTHCPHGLPLHTNTPPSFSNRCGPWVGATKHPSIMLEVKCSGKGTLGNGVSNPFCCRTVFNDNCLAFDKFSNEVVADVNVFGFSRSRSIGRQCHAYVVTLNHPCRSLGHDVEIGTKLT